MPRNCLKDLDIYLTKISFDQYLCPSKCMCLLTYSRLAGVILAAGPGDLAAALALARTGMMPLALEAAG